MAKVVFEDLLLSEAFCAMVSLLAQRTVEMSISAVDEAPLAGGVGGAIAQQEGYGVCNLLRLGHSVL